MLSPHIYAAFAHERHQTFLAQAETDRRNRQAQLIRPVRSADAPLLADGFARLSERSRRLRFLSPKKELQYEIMLGAEGTGE